MKTEQKEATASELRNTADLNHSVGISLLRAVMGAVTSADGWNEIEGHARDVLAEAEMKLEAAHAAELELYDRLQK